MAHVAAENQGQPANRRGNDTVSQNLKGQAGVCVVIHRRHCYRSEARADLMRGRVAALDEQERLRRLRMQSMGTHVSGLVLPTSTPLPMHAHPARDWSATDFLHVRLDAFWALTGSPGVSAAGPEPFSAA